MSKRKAKATKPAASSELPRPPKRRWWIGIIAVLAIVAAVLVFLSQREQKNTTVSPTVATQNPQSGPLTIVIKNDKQTIVVTEAEAVQLVNSLLSAIEPSNPENSYMTPFMKEKINWVFSKVAQKRLKIEGRALFQKFKDGADNTAGFMDSGYYSVNGDGKPPYSGILNLYIPRLYTYVRIQQQTPVGFNQLTKNTFALMVVHEAVHLEQPPEFYVRDYSAQQQIREEARTWLKVNKGAVRPLRRMGQPLESDFIDCDEILKRCGNNPTCPEFLGFITGAGKFASPRYYH